MIDLSAKADAIWDFAHPGTSYRTLIKSFLKSAATAQYSGEEVLVKVSKGTDNHINEEELKKPYTIFVERPIGAYANKDTDFTGYLSGIFGSKSVTATTEKSGSTMEHLTVNISGSDASLKANLDMKRLTPRA